MDIKVAFLHAMKLNRDVYAHPHAENCNTYVYVLYLSGNDFLLPAFPWQLTFYGTLETKQSLAKLSFDNIS